ncbi:MAG: CvpA family protein [Ruminococcus sp.]|nr:CvpA family protein [Ruminococcus sp.]
MIYDIIVIAILIISLFVGYKVGAAKMLVSMLSGIASFVLAAIFGDFCAQLIYDSYLSTAIINSVSSTVVNSGAGELVTAELPPFVSFAMMLTGFDYDNALKTSLESLPQAIATGFETAVRPVVMSVLEVVLTLLIFVIIYFVLRLVLRAVLNFVFTLPVLKVINKVFGVVLSFVSSLLFVSFLAFLLNIIMPYLTDIPFWLSESTIYNSYIFYHFYSGNIFINLISAF